MRVTGLLLWGLGAVRMHKDGQGFQEVWRVWHPLTWAALVLVLLPCAVMGEKLSEVVPLQLKPFWRLHSNQLQWVTPFTRLDSLKPFDPALARRTEYSPAFHPS